MIKTQTIKSGQRLGMQVNASDRVHSLLTATNLMAAVIVVALFLIWLFGTLPASPLSRPDKGTLTAVLSETEAEFAEPGIEEFPELASTQLAADISAVTEAVSTVSASGRVGKTNGRGSRKPGTPPPPTPEHKRWIINYDAIDIDQYADQLSQFGIDIGVIHTTTNRIWRIHDAGRAPSVIESDRKRENKTLRFTHKDAVMQQWDKTFVRRENVDLKNTIVCQFYPETARVQLRQAETLSVLKAEKTIEDIKQTAFKIVASGDRFAFEVTEIQYH